MQQDHKDASKALNTGRGASLWRRWRDCGPAPQSFFVVHEERLVCLRYEQEW